MDEAQGVEFDKVVLVGISNNNICSFNTITNKELRDEKKRVNRDLMYVALTRAMSELHVLGKDSLKEIMS